EKVEKLLATRPPVCEYHRTSCQRTIPTPPTVRVGCGCQPSWAPAPTQATCWFTPTTPDAPTGTANTSAGNGLPVGREESKMTAVRGLMFAAVLLALGVPFLHGGGAKKEAPEPEKVSYYKDVRPIFQLHCQGCHQP